MCFTLISYGDLNKEVFLHSLSKMEANNHGFAMKTKNNIIRTMSEEAFLNRSLKNGFDNQLHLHYRLSTNKIDEKYVHLWSKGGNFTFAHNGIIRNQEHENDSLGFLIDNYYSILNMDIPSIKKSCEEIDGYAVFTINYENNESIVVSCNKSVKIQKIKGSNTIVFLSDFLDFNKKVAYKKKRKVEFNGFEFNEEENVLVDKLECYSTEINNTILFIDKNGNLKKRVNITPKRDIFSNGFSGSYYNKYSDLF